MLFVTQNSALFTVTGDDGTTACFLSVRFLTIRHRGGLASKMLLRPTCALSKSIPLTTPGLNTLQVWRTICFFPQIAGSYRGSYFSKVRSSVANFVAKFGKGAMQGAVQAAWEAAVQTAVARSGKGALQGAVQGLCRLSGCLGGCCPNCGGAVWQTCSAGCFLFRRCRPCGGGGEVWPGRCFHAVAKSGQGAVQGGV